MGSSLDQIINRDRRSNEHCFRLDDRGFYSFDLSHVGGVSFWVAVVQSLNGWNLKGHKNEVNNPYMKFLLLCIHRNSIGVLCCKHLCNKYILKCATCPFRFWGYYGWNWRIMERIWIQLYRPFYSFSRFCQTKYSTKITYKDLYVLISRQNKI